MQEYLHALREDQYTFMIVSLSVLRKMRNVADKICTRNPKTRFMLISFFIDNGPIYEKCGKIL